MPPKVKKARRTLLNAKRTKATRSDGGGDATGTGASERKIKKTPISKKLVQEVSRYVICDKLAERFNEVLIHVEQVITSAHFLPVRVWCQPSNEEYLLEKYKYTLRTRTTNFAKVIPVSYLNKWKNPTRRKKDILDCAYKEIDNAMKHLILTSDEKWSGPDSSILQDFSDSDDTSDSDDSDSSSDGSGGDSVPYLFGFRASRAFLGHMHNSAGRDFLMVFLEYAIKAGLGKNKHGMAGVYQVGTAPCYYRDGFPLDLVNVHENQEGKLKWRSVSMRRGSSHECRSHSKSVTPASPGRSSSPCLSSRSVSPAECAPQQNKASYIYSDLVIATIHKGWAKFVMLCEVKSGYDVITPLDYVQLLQQMIAACMHQTEVLGLVINARFAKILWLKHNPDEKTLLCYDLTDTPCFVPTVGNSFLSAGLKELLFQLVVALNYCKKNICEVKPFEIKSS